MLGPPRRRLPPRTGRPASSPTARLRPPVPRLPPPWHPKTPTTASRPAGSCTPDAAWAGAEKRGRLGRAGRLEPGRARRQQPEPAPDRVLRGRRGGLCTTHCGAALTAPQRPSTGASGANRLGAVAVCRCGPRETVGKFDSARHESDHPGGWCTGPPWARCKADCNAMGRIGHSLWPRIVRNDRSLWPQIVRNDR